MAGTLRFYRDLGPPSFLVFLSVLLKPQVPQTSAVQITFDRPIQARCLNWSVFSLSLQRCD